MAKHSLIFPLGKPVTFRLPVYSLSTPLVVRKLLSSYLAAKEPKLLFLHPLPALSAYYHYHYYYYCYYHYYYYYHHYYHLSLSLYIYIYIHTHRARQYLSALPQAVTLKTPGYDDYNDDDYGDCNDYRAASRNFEDSW